MKRRFTCISLFYILFASNILGQCTIDCVWPGDANANGIANHIDILALGLSWGNTGPVRSNTSVNWEPLNAYNWAGALPNTAANFKHCDSDGNGEISFPDITPITNNFGQTNSNFTNVWGNNITGNDLSAIPQQNTVIPGETLLVNLELGSASNPIQDIYGIGFTLSMNSDYVESINMLIDNSWMAITNPNAELIPYLKYPLSDNKTYIALSRHDGQAISGFGTIATLELVIVDAIVALQVDSTACLTLDLKIENVLGINEMEDDLLITSKNDSVNIKHHSQITPVMDIDDDPKFDIFPNPTKGIININSLFFHPHTITITNLFGQRILMQKVEQTSTDESSVTISVNHLDTGIYFLEIIGKDKSFVRKISIY